ncbi:putative PEP-binding protein [Lyngbya sp. PCC 8106]|uniref:putative PEP-binding protein n=1 Tax=Lyngbya sp. (strain PCC 8106) TaxID=313612 RepID=UPI0000EAAC42|nr:putative PEP-binding protein [Lyngbya sp. PCC 8106]EAW37102.1 PEP-utilizing enzyme [Lyngbya sp. PCC 8106]
MSFSLLTTADGVENLHWLHNIRPTDRSIVGDRGFYLGDLIQEGYPVIPGFVVSAKIYREFLETIDWQEPILVDFPTSSLHIDLKDPRQLQAIAQRIRHQIITSSLSSEFRSILQSSLNTLNAQALIFHPSLRFPLIPTNGLFDPVMSWAKLDTVELGIKQAWAELFRARNLLYWQRNNIQLAHLQPTILVQPIPEAIASGSVRFDAEVWDIKATWGLELATFWGQTHPDHYQINPQTQELQHQKLGYKTIGYSLKSSTSTQLSNLEGQWSGLAQCTLSPLHSPIEAKLLGPEYQESVLKPAQLQSLMELVKPIATHLGKSGLIEWIMCESCEFFISRVCIVDADSIPKNNSGIDSEINSEKSSGDLRGIAASSGRIVGKAYILATPSQVQTHLFPTGAILVVKTMIPELLSLLQRAAGLITEQGGMTGHGAILARELGIPAVIGVQSATEQIKMGESVLVDGDRGEVHRILSQNMTTDQPFSTLETNLETKPIISENWLRVPIATQLMVNVSQSSSFLRLKNFKDLPIDGVGLVRSELMALDLLNSENPSVDFRQWLHPQNQSKFIEGMVADLQQLASTIAPRPLCYRALDLREFHQEVRPFWNGENSELAALTTVSHCDNHCQDQYSTLFELELAVLSKLNQLGFNHIRLILPFVRSVEEFCIYRRYIEKTGLTRNPHFQVWIMAEVPSVVFLVSDYIKAGVQGIAIGTNDLTQFLLGIDRNQTCQLSHLNELHPAMLKVIQKLIKEARKAKIPCSICGDAPVLYPELIDYLVRWGVTSISVNPDAIEKTYLAIARAEHLLMLEHSRSRLKD